MLQVSPRAGTTHRGMDGCSTPRSRSGTTHRGRWHGISRHQRFTVRANNCGHGSKLTYRPKLLRHPKRTWAKRRLLLFINIHQKRSARWRNPPAMDNLIDHRIYHLPSSSSPGNLHFEPMYPQLGGDNRKGGKNEHGLPRLCSRSRLTFLPRLWHDTPIDELPWVTRVPLIIWPVTVLPWIICPGGRLPITLPCQHSRQTIGDEALQRHEKLEQMRA